VWQNGGKAGDLIVDLGKAERIIEILNADHDSTMRLRDPDVVARALHLYRYNVSQGIRITEWWERRFGEPMRQKDADKWFARFGGVHPVEVPVKMDDLSHHALVELAMERYGDEAQAWKDVCARKRWTEEEPNE
jgi:hypothetical protein